ncbi:MAG TPA: AzlD domain-containing protein [Thermoleophilaceae bacterium]
MTEVWTTIGVLAVVGAVIKASGPVLVGGRELPGWANGVIALLAPALLAALVLVDTFASDRSLVVDARAAGLAAAIAAIAVRAPLLVVVVGAAAVTAAVRALT